MFIYLFISLLILTINEEERLLYPTILTLLSHKIVLVINNGIHFYDANMENEDLDKYVPLNIPDNDLDSFKTAMAQFSADDNGYILILAMNIIYFFRSDGTSIISKNLSNIIDGSYYCITPYKKENNYLHYIISYTNNSDFTMILNHFKFDINSNENILENLKKLEIMPDDINPMQIGLAGMTCIVMFDSILHYDILTCFYSVSYPGQIHSRSFDPRNSFNEIEDYYSCFNNDPVFYTFPTYVSAVTNLDKTKALVFLVFAASPYWMTFDFENEFSEIIKEENDISLLGHYAKSKMFFFRQTHEFFIISEIGACKKYILIFKNDFTIKNKLVYEIKECFNSFYFTAFYRNGYYYVVSDSANPVDTNFLFIQPLLDFEETPIVESPIEISEDSPETENIPVTSIVENVPETSILENAPVTSIVENVPVTSIVEKVPVTSIVENVPVTSVIEQENTIPSTNEEISNKLTEKTFSSDIITENLENYSNNIKCKTSSIDSSLYNLCTSCNDAEGYFPVEIKNSDLFHGFIECYNEKTKPKNFYFNNSEKKYKICYETCLTCNEEGDEYNNNCIECDLYHIKKPEYSGTKNCVTECQYSYYYTSYGQYKCTNNNNCPEEKNLYIKELKKCTDDCSKEELYIYQYGGQCLKICPKNTYPNENNICKDESIDSCSLSESEINLEDYIVSGGIDLDGKNYAKEFSYTKKHISHFYNNIYSILFYKEINCIEELSIKMPKIDFGNCYLKVQNSINTTDKIIIVLIEEIKENQNNKISYYFYHPITGEKINDKEICKDETIVIKESVLSQLNESNVDLNSALFLSNQNIDIFNLSDKFYTDICFHFDSPNGKDIPLKERIHIYYPNITLCDEGCTVKGVNLTSMESICECNINNLINNDLIEGNVFLEKTLGEITEILSNSNLDVLQCFNDVFNKKYFKKATGGFIILTIFIMQIFLSFLFLYYEMGNIMSYIYNQTENYINFLESNNIKNPPKKNKKSNLYINIKKDSNTDESSRKTTYFLKSDKDNESFKKRFSINSRTKKNEKNKSLKKQSKQNNLYIYIKKEKKAKNKTSNKDTEIVEYLKTDLDEMDYDDAVKKDKREFCQFFLERIKEKQMIINTFCNKSNIRPLSIKIILFLLNIDLYFVINGLFFSEEYIIELYHLENEDKFFSFFPRSIGRFFYATGVGVIIGIIIDCIFIEEKKIKKIFLRDKKDHLRIRYEIFLIIKSLKKRYIVFIFICFLISIISWYYVSCFNNVYPGVKVEWIKSSITIICIMQLLSIFIALLEALLREISFKCKSEKTFKLKQVLS